MSSYLMTPPTIPRKRARQCADSMTFEPMLATPELVMSRSNASFDSVEPTTPTMQRTFTSNVLPPPTPRFTRTHTPMSKVVVPPSPSPAARFRVKTSTSSTSFSASIVPVTPVKVSRVPTSAPPATPIHQQRVGPPRTPSTPSPVSIACPVAFDPFMGYSSSSSSSSASSKDLPFRATHLARASIQRASNALQDLLFDSADPFVEREMVDPTDMDMDVDDAFGPIMFSTPLKSKAASLLPTPEPEAPCTPPRQVRRGLPRSPRHWNLASVNAVKA